MTATPPITVAQDLVRDWLTNLPWAAAPSIEVGLDGKGLANLPEVAVYFTERRPLQPLGEPRAVTVGDQVVCVTAAAELVGQLVLRAPSQEVCHQLLAALDDGLAKSAQLRDDRHHLKLGPLVVYGVQVDPLQLSIDGSVYLPLPEDAQTRDMWRVAFGVVATMPHVTRRPLGDTPDTWRLAHGAPTADPSDFDGLGGEPFAVPGG